MKQKWCVFIESRSKSPAGEVAFRGLVFYFFLSEKIESKIQDFFNILKKQAFPFFRLDILRKLRQSGN